VGRGRENIEEKGVGINDRKESWWEKMGRERR